MTDGTLRERVIRLLHRVPRTPQQLSPGGAGQSELDDLVSRLGVPLPPDLAGWLRVCRGDAIGPGGVFGARPDDKNHDIAVYLAMHPSWRNISDAGGDGKGYGAWLPVAGDGCGNYYVLVTAGPLVGFVAFVDSMTDPDRLDYVVASNLWQFLKSRRGCREIGLALDDSFAVQRSRNAGGIAFARRRRPTEGNGGLATRGPSRPWPLAHRFR